MFYKDVLERVENKTESTYKIIRPQEFSHFVLDKAIEAFFNVFIKKAELHVPLDLKTYHYNGFISLEELTHECSTHSQREGAYIHITEKNIIHLIHSLYHTIIDNFLNDMVDRGYVDMKWCPIREELIWTA